MQCGPPTSMCCSQLCESPWDMNTAWSKSLKGVTCSVHLRGCSHPQPQTCALHRACLITRDPTQRLAQIRTLMQCEGSAASQCIHCVMLINSYEST